MAEMKTVMINGVPYRMRADMADRDYQPAVDPFGDDYLHSTPGYELGFEDAEKAASADITQSYDDGYAAAEKELEDQYDRKLEAAENRAYDEGYQAAHDDLKNLGIVD